MLYEPVQSQRYFNRDQKYAEINWACFPDIVDAFDQRIRCWYIEPIEVLLERGVNQRIRRLVQCLGNRKDGGHYSFSVMAMTSLLIDTLAQFESGAVESSASGFMAFVRDHLPGYNVDLDTSIYVDPPQKKKKNDLKSLLTIAQVLYTGF